MLEEKKKKKKISFQVKNGEPVEALVNRLNRLGVQVDQFNLPGRGLVERCKKPSISSSSLSFLVEGYFFPVEV